VDEFIVGVTPRNDEVTKLERKANEGDLKALEKLAEHYDAHPELWKSAGDMARNIIMTTAARIFGDNLAFRDCLVRRAQEIRNQAAGPQPTPLEKLLAERIGVCWIQLQHAEYHASWDGTIEQADFRQRRLDRAHRRYLSAIKALAVIRRIQLPVMQINIGEKQVNLVAPDTNIPVAEPDSDESRKAKMNGHGEKLSRKQGQAISGLLAARTIADAAKDELGLAFDQALDRVRPESTGDGG